MATKTKHAQIDCLTEGGERDVIRSESPEDGDVFERGGRGSGEGVGGEGVDYRPAPQWRNYTSSLGFQKFRIPSPHHFLSFAQKRFGFH
ncbi:hypothetical protein CDAR_244351 [Caerostris darwini]|uniref:Uncharacterized protein n=1 Tax=Caerostris darwini TaxID=1538125 RepID=A0AAV4RHC2_9ARAC|nr:hypothetical protein CDAR_244351 [Caerostris darwini]